jgi:hypothetical protein
MTLTPVKALANLAPGRARMRVLHANVERGILLLHALVERLELFDAGDG